MRTAAAYLASWLVASIVIGAFYYAGGLSPWWGGFWGFVGALGHGAGQLTRWLLTRDTGFPADDDPELLEPWITAGVVADGSDRDPAPFRVTPDSRIVWNDDTATVGFRPVTPSDGIAEIRAWGTDEVVAEYPIPEQRKDTT